MDGRPTRHFTAALNLLPTALALSLAIAAGWPSAAAAERAESLYHRALGLDEMRAIPLLLRANRLAPRNKQIIYRLGFLYQKMSRLTEAERYYEATLRLDPCHLKALNNLGGLRLDQRRDREATGFYLRAVRCKGSYYLPYYNLAGLYLEGGAVGQAAEMYAESLRRNPKHAASHHNLGIALERLAKTDAAGAAGLRARALVHLRRACELEPKNALNYFNYGRLLFNMNRMGEVEAPLRRAISLAPGDSHLIGRALAMIAQIPPPEAVKTPPAAPKAEVRKEPATVEREGAKSAP